MTDRLTKNTFSIVEVISTDTASGEKKRPVYILKTNGVVFQCYIITTKYDDKPNHIKPYFLEIIDIEHANLFERSWINTYDLYNLPVEKVRTTFIGTLSEKDTERLIKLLSNDLHQHNE